MPSRRVTARAFARVSLRDRPRRQRLFLAWVRIVSEWDIRHTHRTLLGRDCAENKPLRP